MGALDVVILAAGKGTRMKSALPKVLMPLAGRALLDHVLEAALQLQPNRVVVVVGHQAERIEDHLASLSCADRICIAHQKEQLGTGDAVKVALKALAGSTASHLLVLYADVPLIKPEQLRALVECAQRRGPEGFALLTAFAEKPAGYGRVVRDATGAVARIVEERDASKAERALAEINAGIMVLPYPRCQAWLEALTPHNAQGEYYLTDLVALAYAEGMRVEALAAPFEEVQGINDAAQLAAAERCYQRRIAAALLAQGVRLADPERIDVRGTLICAQDVFIDVGCIFEGRVVLEKGVRVGPYAVLRDCCIGAGSEILAFSHIVGAELGSCVRVGPFARIRPQSRLEDGVEVGNFVEVKNSSLGAGTKANHLSYLGDAEVGAGVNIGAGAITCNYDGVAKHKTIIEDGAFIGSDTQLIAPVRVGRNATIGAGTTLTRDAPEEALTLSRVAQKTIPNWKRRRRD